MRLLLRFVVGEAECLARHGGDQSFAQAEAGLNVDLVVLSVRRVGGVNDVGVFRWDDLLY